KSCNLVQRLCLIYTNSTGTLVRSSITLSHQSILVRLSETRSQDSNFLLDHSIQSPSVRPQPRWPSALTTLSATSCPPASSSQPHFTTQHAGKALSAAIHSLTKLA